MNGQCERCAWRSKGKYGENLCVLTGGDLDDIDMDFDGMCEYFEDFENAEVDDNANE